LFRNFNFDIPDAYKYTSRACIATAFSLHRNGTPLRKQATASDVHQDRETFVSFCKIEFLFADRERAD